MALLGHAFRGLLPTALVGIGSAILVPVVRPAAEPVVRPLAKALIKGGLRVADFVRETAAEATEQMSDLVAEARAENAGTTPASAGAANPVKNARKPRKA